MNKTIKKDLILLEDLGYLLPNEYCKKKVRFAIYRCYCGNKFKARVGNVNNFHTSSCGCSKITHSLTNHRLYNTWKDMIRRCNSPKRKDYKDYGGRGISVCDRWLDIHNFIEDMYPSYIEGLTLDRKDVNGNYCNDNCRWANKNTQARNKKLLQTNNLTSYRGVSKKGNRYVSRVGINTKIINLGTYGTAIEAAKVRDKYIIDNNLEHTLNFKIKDKNESI